MPVDTVALDALKVALRIEDEGRAFYLEAAGKSENNLTRQVFSDLADQELVHKRVFQQVYDRMCLGETCPVIELPEGEAQKARQIFGKLTKAAVKVIRPSTAEQEAIVFAQRKEIESRDFYARQADRATDPVEKKFFRVMAGEEQGHYVELSDYKEFLINPAGYFVMKERHSLDGA
ncbi:MAG: ferritin family protein [Chloroflexi bacterium]|nr:ferritin family protein [Chloroflexota bacterium]